MLQRLESLPFDGILDWDVGMSVWRYYNERICRRQGTGLCRDSGASLHGPGSTTLESDHSTEQATCVGTEPGPEGELDSSHGDQLLSPSSSEVAAATIPACDPEPDSQSTQPPPPTQPSGIRYSPESSTRDCKPTKLTFRVTCTRGGRKHCFSSIEAAGCFGAGIARYFDWGVKLKDPDVEVLLCIMEDGATVRIALSREGKFKRNIAHFGPTTLRSTIAHGLLR